ncbi:MAG: hypothetical protein HYZ20_02480 [Burkholderiales bacterium]|nr:hypothetical protein [Burkholderiales bacterium]
MSTISSITREPLQSTASTQAATSAMGQAVKDLAKALRADDLETAKKAYVQVIKSAPEGASWNAGSPIAQLGRALHGGDIAAAKDVMRSAFQDFRAMRPPVVPAPPQDASTLPAKQDGALHVVA